MKRLFSFTLVLLFGLSACAGPTATESAPAPAPQNDAVSASPADQTAPQARLDEVINRVEAHAMPGEDWSAALVEMPLYPGGEVWAKESSTALVQFLTREGVLRVAPNTIFTLEHPDPQTLKIKLDSGQIWVNIEGLEEGESFEVETPNATAAVRGTRFSVRVDKDGRTIITVVEGLVDVRTDQGSEQAKPKSQVTVLPDGTLLEPGKIPYEELIPWGLAGGPNLETIAPVAELSDSLTVEGLVKAGAWSADSSLFSYNIYTPGKESRQAFYNLGQRQFFEPQNLPEKLFDIFYNPASDGMAWVQDGSPSLEICTAANDGSQKTCFGSDRPDFSPNYPRWSPDGQWLLYWLRDSNATVLVISRPDGSQARVLETPGIGQPRRHTWSPDGSQVAYASPSGDTYDSPGEVWVMQAGQSGLAKIFEGLQNANTTEPLSWSPDGKWLALPGVDGLYLVSPDGVEKRKIPGVGTGGYYALTWSKTPSGWPLLFKYSDPETKTGGTFFVTDENGTALETIFSAAWGPVYSPDGRLAAFGSIENLGSSEEPIYQSTIYFYSTLP
jgi:WD40 repeat protein